MLPHDARQLKHADLWLAKHGLQFGIGDDETLVFGILQVMDFDVVPDLFDDLGAGNGRIANHGGQRGAGGRAAARSRCFCACSPRR